MLCVSVGDVMDVVFSACIVTRGAVCTRIMGSMSVSSCRCCIFVFVCILIIIIYNICIAPYNTIL